MRQLLISGKYRACHRRRHEHGNIRIVLALVLAGLIAGAIWYVRSGGRGAASDGPGAMGNRNIELSPTTKAILKGLDGSVEIRFYSLLDAASVPASLQTFARRVAQLLDAYEREANGKLKVTHYDSLSDANANAAAADGIKAFNRDKGNVCYLGLVVAQNDQKESLPQLAPEWEQAVEPDLSRAIQRVAAAAPTAQTAANAPTTDPAILEEVKRAVPNLNSVSAEDGIRILREASLQEFKAAAAQLQAQLKEAQGRLNQAQNSQSETEQQAALKEFQELQAAQAERLKQIAARSQSRIEALKQLKAGAK